MTAYQPGLATHLSSVHTVEVNVEDFFFSLPSLTSSQFNNFILAKSLFFYSRVIADLELN